MKSIVILSLIAICACQLASVQASPSYRQKRALAQGQCPEKAATEEACLKYVQREIFQGKLECSRVTTNGKFFEIAGCGSISCVIDGKEITPTEVDLSKSYPDCCPKC